MKFRTELGVNPFPFNLSHSDAVVFFGSCFSENIGHRFQQLAYQTLVNPHGILFGSPAILANLKRVLNKELPKDNELLEAGTQWAHWYGHSALYGSSKQELLQNIAAADAQTRSYLKQARVCFITLGSSWVYRHKKENFVVGNCHKQEANVFVKELQTNNQVEADLQAMITLLRDFNPKLEIVFTVSPVKHIRDGLVENNLSKAILLVATQQMAAKNEQVHYFPAYELLSEDLRDYRYYAADMAHPSEQAVNYIWEKLCTTIFSADELQLNVKIERLRNAQNHRPLFPDSMENKSFQANLKRQLEQFYTETGIQL